MQPTTRCALSDALTLCPDTVVFFFLLSALNVQQPAETTALLTRLASKPGVQSTLILSKADGSIIRTSGLISQPASSSPSASLKGSTSGGVVSSSGLNEGPATTDMEATENSNGYEEGRGGGGAGMKSAEEVARMVWTFVDAVGGLVVGLDAEDEAKLLRLRTKKNELVIVPDSKFLLVVIHETPPA
ncbi:MAG: hypothetical protein M1830_001760 [Pleopsidium flavum]|nr:MAG: hypothetical protein M1830_001760 [Pleopsidium flavum]